MGELKRLSRALLATAVIVIASLVSCLAPFVATPVAAQSMQTIRVGVYGNYPKIYRDNAGNIKGFWAQITNYIAQKENWKVDYVYGTFSQGLQRLSNGQIDTMVDVAVDPQRQQMYDFNSVTLLSGWAEVYEKPGENITSFLDLRGKTIAVMQGDIHYIGPSGILSALSSFNISANYVTVGSYEGVFSQIDQGKVDAGIVNWLFGKTNQNQYHVQPTNIIFDPVDLRYAFLKGAPNNQYFIDAIDSNVISLKQDPNSAYYQALDNTIGPYTRTVEKLPGWYYPTVIIAGILILLSITFVISMRGYQQLLKREIQKRIGQIKDSEERYSAVVNQAQDAIMIIQDEEIIYVNKAIGLIGYSEKELIGKHFSDFIAPDELKKVKGFYYSRMAGNATPPMYETRLLHKNGMLIDVEVSSGVINYLGEPADLIMVRDITQRKKLQEEVKLQNSILYAELELSINGVLIVDKDSNIILYNQRFVDMWDVPADALETKSSRVVLNSIVHLIKNPQAFVRNVDFLYRHRTKKDHDEIELADGRTFERYTSPIYIDETDYVGRVWFFQDITDQKKQAEKLAQLEKAKTEFVSVAAHQLRAPIASIKTVSSVVRDVNSVNLNRTQKEFLDKIVNEAEQMNELVHFLLRISKAEGGVMSLRPTPLKLDKLTSDLISELSSDINSKHMKVVVRNRPSVLPKILVDKNALTQVILNLLSNAIDYSPAGSEVAITITIQGSYVQFAVKDSGIGIPEADQSRIFDKFYRTDKAKEVSGTGAGLGLALAKSIVEALGGKIWVESEVGKGSTFFFTFPVSVEEKEIDVESEAKPLEEPPKST
jgi:PAS domain S-box-containing protein